MNILYSAVAGTVAVLLASVVQAQEFHFDHLTPTEVQSLGGALDTTILLQQALIQGRVLPESAGATVRELATLARKLNAQYAEQAKPKAEDVPEK